MEPPPSSMVTSFDWSQLERYHLPYYIPFHIIVDAYNIHIPITIIDEGVVGQLALSGSLVA